MIRSIKLSIKIHLFLLFFSLPVLIHSQSIFERGFGTAEDDIAVAVCKMSSGGYAVAGYTKGYSPQLIMNPFIVRFDQNGQYIWSTYISTPSGLCVTGIAEDAFGNLVGCASGSYQFWSQSSPQTIESDSILVFKLSSTGSLVWQEYVHGNYIRDCGEIAVAASGNILVASSRKLTSSSKEDAVVLQFNSSGTLQGEKVYSSFGNNAFNDVWPTNDGNFLFCSLASDTLNNDYAFIVKTDENGDSLWTQHFFITNRPSNHPSSINTIAERNNGDIVIGGSKGELSWARAFILQLDSTCTINQIPGGDVITPSGLADKITELTVSPLTDDITGAHATYNFGSRFSVIHYDPEYFNIGNYYFYNVAVSNFAVYYHMREANAIVDDSQPPFTISNVVVGSTTLSGYGKEDFAILKTNNTLNTINQNPPIISNHGQSTICQGDSTLLTLDANGQSFHHWANLLGQSDSITGAIFDLGVYGDSLWVSEEGTYVCIAFDADSNIYVSNIKNVSIGVDTIKIDHTLPLAYCAAAGQADSTVLFVSNMDPSLYPVTYQWYEGINQPVAISGATDSFYVAKPTYPMYYFCRGTTSCGDFETNGLIVRPDASPQYLSTLVVTCQILSACTTQSFGWFGNDTTSTYTWYDSTGVVLPVTSSTYSPGIPIKVIGVAQNACGKDSITFTSSLNNDLKPGLSSYLNCASGSVLLTVDNPKLATSNISWNFNGTIIPGITTDTLTVFQTGTYEAHFEDSLCPGLINIQSSTVYGTPGIPPFTVTSVDTMLCPGELGTTLIAPPIPGATYAWSRIPGGYYASTPTAFVYLWGYYLVTITNGCDTEMGSIYIYQDTTNVYITPQGPTTFCQGDSVLLTSSPIFTNYQWYRYNTPIPGATFMNYTAKSRGKYKCIAENVGLCTDTSNIITVYVPCMPPLPNQQRTELDQDTNADIQIFPNPGTGIFTIESPPGILEIFNSIGKLIYSKEIVLDINTIDITPFSDGIYNVILKTEVSVSTRRIILSR